MVLIAYDWLIAERVEPNMAFTVQTRMYQLRASGITAPIFLQGINKSVVLVLLH